MDCVPKVLSSLTLSKSLFKEHHAHTQLPHSQLPMSLSFNATIAVMVGGGVAFLQVPVLVLVGSHTIPRHPMFITATALNTSYYNQ